MASSDVSSSLASLLRLASWIICLLVIASFLIFVVDQTGSASAHQQAELNASSPITANEPDTSETTGTSTKHKSSLHKQIDEAANVFTSPFNSIVSGTSSQWATRSIKTFLALLVYGLGLGYLARVIRVHV
jgi:hypothetical protein